MKEFKYISIIILLFSCNTNTTINYDHYLINDVFMDLVNEDYLFESFIEYKNRVEKSENDQSDVHVIYEEYLKSRKEKEKLNLFIYDKLSPLDKEVIEIVENTDNYHLGVNESSFNPKVDIKLDENISFSSFEDATIGYFRFSRVSYNVDMNKAFFVYEFNCPDECYKKYIGN